MSSTSGQVDSGVAFLVLNCRQLFSGDPTIDFIKVSLFWRQEQCCATPLINVFCQLFGGDPAANLIKPLLLKPTAGDPS
jgi:hypothetical protein